MNSGLFKFRHLTAKWLVAFLVGLLVVMPGSPGFLVLAEDDDENDGPTWTQEQVDLVTSDEFIDNLVKDPSLLAQELGIGPSSDEDDVEGVEDVQDVENDENEDNSSDPPDLPDENVDDITGDPGPESQPGPDEEAGPEGQPGPDEPVGPEGQPGPDTPGNQPVVIEDPGAPAAGGSSIGSITIPTIPEPELPERVEELMTNPPTTQEDIRAWRDKYYDEISLTTDDTNTTPATETNTAPAEPTTSSEIDLSGDDNIANAKATTTDEAVIETDQTLEQDNVTTGAAVSGDNVLESGKDVLQGTIDTGQAGITSTGEVKGNTSSYDTIYGGAGDWVQKSFGTEAGNSNTGADNILDAAANEVRSLTVVNKNLAFVNNIKDLLAKSGGNRISGIGRVDESNIRTGLSAAKSSLLNIINTNTVDSAFLPITFDIFDNFKGNINILELLFEAFGANLDGPNAITATAANDNSGADSILSARARTQENIDITNENEGYIYNELDLRAISGQNKLLANRKLKESFIETDKSVVANNLVNFLNTNLFRSKIGVVVINVFAKSWLGNLVLPSAAKFAGQVADPSNAVAATETQATGTDDSINNALAIAHTDLEIVSEDHGAVLTEIEIEGNTGKNFAGFDKDAGNIREETGNSQVRSSILTLTNKSVVGTAFSQGFFNILGGQWVGELVGVPGSARLEGSERSFIVADEAAALSGQPTVAAEAVNNSDGADDSIALAQAEVRRSVSVRNRDQGRVVNRLKILADSGRNDASAYKGEDVAIKTGDVGVANNVATFLNNDFAFSKGLLVALNVFGDWQGNVAYDEFKDLAVGVKLLAEVAALEPGSEVRYLVEARNSGTEPTEPGTLSFSYDASQFELVDAAGASVSGTILSWSYGAFMSAESLEKIVTLKLRNDLEPGQHSISVSAAITASDFNERNNSEIEVFALSIPDSSAGGPGLGADNSNQGDLDDSSGDSGDDSTFNAAIGDSDSGANDSNNGAANGSNSPDIIQGGSGGGGYRPGTLVISKTVQAGGPFGPGDKVLYQVSVQNPGTAAVHNVIVYDVLKNGVIDSESSWPLDTVAGGEEVLIDYELELREAAPTDTYTNTAYASGFNAANQVVRSEDVSTSIQVVNPDMPASGSGGIIQGGDDLEVIDAFNRSATSTLDITRENQANDNVPTGSRDPRSSDQIGDLENFGTNSVLTEAEETALEEAFEQDMRANSSISRRLAPVAQAADFEDEGGTSADFNLNGSGEPDISGASSTRLAVYPSFLQFDGLERGVDVEKSGGGPIYTSWLFWLFVILILLAAFVSYKEKQRQQFHY